MPKMTPEAEARYALNFNIARSGLSMPAQLAYDQLLRDGYGRAKEEEEEPDAVFPALGVQVRGERVESHLPGYLPRALGPLAGAQAQNDGRPSGLEPGAGYIPAHRDGRAGHQDPRHCLRDLPCGSYHERALDSNKAVGAAQSEALKFNLLASPPAAQQPQPAQEDTAATLRKLASLHDEGLLTDEEYAAKRAEVIARL